MLCRGTAPSRGSSNEPCGTNLHMRATHIHTLNLNNNGGGLLPLYTHQTYHLQHNGRNTTKTPKPTTPALAVHRPGQGTVGRVKGLEHDRLPLLRVHMGVEPPALLGIFWVMADVYFTSAAWAYVRV